MPYVFDFTQQALPDDGSDPPPPKVSEFQYMTAQVFGTPPGPVKLPPVETDDKGLFEELEDAVAFLAAAHKAGVSKFYCRFDGGNDEGFAWVDSAEIAGGARLDKEALARKLLEVGFAIGERTQWQATWSDERIVLDRLDFALANSWAAALLGGPGYGTGEFLMYGAFTADLAAGTITDDPGAAPEVRNVTIDFG